LTQPPCRALYTIIESFALQWDTSNIITEAAVNAVKGAAGTASDKASEASGYTKGDAEELAGKAKGKAYEVTGQAKGKAEELKGEAKAKMS
jgi:hypothetical protein